MPLRDMFFWFFLTIFGTGTFVIFEKHVVWGVVLIGTGLLGMVGCAWPYIVSQQVFAHYLNSRSFLVIVSVILLFCLLLTLAMPELHRRLPGWLGFAVVGVGGAILLCAFWWLSGLIPKDSTQPETTKQPGAQDKRPPTLLDLFKSDFPNTMRSSDQEDAITIKWKDGGVTKIKRQVYMDFPAKTKFAGFYIPTPPSLDLSGDKTFQACMIILEHNAVQEAFDDVSKSVAISMGQGGQMTGNQDLTFSGRVLLYHQEFLSIPQKADILKTYAAKNLHVQFMGPDYLGPRIIAWHQQHDPKASH